MLFELPFDLYFRDAANPGEMSGKPVKGGPGLHYRVGGAGIANPVFGVERAKNEFRQGPNIARPENLHVLKLRQIDGFLPSLAHIPILPELRGSHRPMISDHPGNSRV